MRYRNVQIYNYKSFRDSGSVILTPGFNVVVGKNDAGKSALLEAVSLRAPSKAHRSPETVPEPGAPHLQRSLVRATIELAPEEVRAILARHATFYFPQKQGEEYHSTVARFQQALGQPGALVAEWVDDSFQRGWFESFEEESQVTGWIQVSNLGHPNDLSLVVNGNVNKTGSSYSEIIGCAFHGSIYTFRAERLNVGECAVGGNAILAPNSSNLAEVLNLLISSNPRKFDRFLAHVRTVFPHVTQITAPVIGNNIARVLIWSVPSETERADLAVPLAESGTGIGQVLAILYVLVTAEKPRVILIDEPQSFLHPGAVRKLFEILRTYSQHQYVITTHAPTAVAATDSESLLRVHRAVYESRVDIISARDEAELRLFLSDVGARLSDVFGADSILWVEGKTEEVCFPVVLRRVSGTPLLGIQILGVQSTGDLEGRIALRVFEVYQRLSTASTLLPPAVAFVLDREGKSDSDRASIDGKSRGRVRWLPRRMYENYLLSSAAITDLLNEEDSERAKAVTSADVERWMVSHGSDRKYFDHGTPIPTYPSAEWEVQVHAGALLQDLLADLSDCRVSYQKVRHGLRLTMHLAERPSRSIIELSTFLSQLLEAVH